MSLRVVWEAYRRYHQRAILSSERIRLIEARLREYPVDLLVDAIDGNHESSFHSGDNSRMNKYHDLGLILRDADRIERFAEIAVNHRPADQVEAAWRYYKLFSGTDDYSDAEALEMVKVAYPEDAYREVLRRVEGDELGDRRGEKSG